MYEFYAHDHCTDDTQELLQESILIKTLMFRRRYVKGKFPNKHTVLIHGQYKRHRWSLDLQYHHGLCTYPVQDSFHPIWSQRSLNVGHNCFASICTHFSMAFHSNFNSTFARSLLDYGYSQLILILSSNTFPLPVATTSLLQGST